MAIFALIEGTLVVNRVGAASLTAAQALFAPLTVVEDGAGLATIGGSYSGGVFSPPPQPVPAEVTMAQARIALSRAGRLADVNTLVTQIGGETLLWWDYATVVERANPLVAALGAQLAPPLSSGDIDALFRVAATIS